MTIDEYQEDVIEELYEDVIKTTAKIDEVYVTDNRIAELLAEPSQKVTQVMESMADYGLIERDYDGTNTTVYIVSGFHTKADEAQEMYEQYFDEDEREAITNIETGEHPPPQGGMF